MSSLYLENSKQNFSEDSKDYKITLEKCPNGGFHCQEILKLINDLFSSADQCIANKEYFKALELKEKAFITTSSIKNEKCLPCGNLFRQMIYESVQENSRDLEKMTTGIFKKKKYLPHLRKSREILANMELIIKKKTNLKQIKKQA